MWIRAVVENLVKQGAGSMLWIFLPTFLQIKSGILVSGVDAGYVIGDTSLQGAGQRFLWKTPESLHCLSVTSAVEAGR